MIVKAVKYGASWCGPCRLTEDNLKKVGISFESIDVDEYDSVADERGVATIPQVDFIDEKGNIVETARGLLTVEKIQEILDKYKA